MSHQKLFSIVVLFILFFCQSYGENSLNLFKPDTSHYHHYDELSKFLHDMESQYPNIAKLHSIGKSVQNRELLAIQITDNINEVEAGEPMFK